MQRRRLPLPGGRTPYAPRPGKYGPIGDFLAGLPEEQAACELEFAQLELLLGMPLPPSARLNWFWHKDEPASHARAWLDHGWRGELAGGARVRFVRDLEHWG